MSQRRKVPRKLTEGGGLDRAGLSPIGENLTLFLIECQQWIACATATLTMFIVGSIHGWTRTSLLHLTSGSDDVPLRLTHDEYSWILFLTVLFSMIGSLVGVQLADRRGRKRCLLICSTIFIAGWIIIYITTSVRMLYLARVIHGIGVGIAHTINPMYVSEVADIKIRGAVCSLITVNVFSGSLLTYSLGSWMEYNTLLMILLTISFLSLLWNTYFPDTPYYLMAKGKVNEACKSIACYKGIMNSNKMQIELRDLRAQTIYEYHPQSRYELHPQSSYELRERVRSDSASQLRTDLPSQSKTDLPSQSRTNLPSQSRTNLPSQSRTDLPSQSRVDLPSQSRTYLPSQSRTDLPSPPRTGLPSPPRTCLPSQSRSNFTISSASYVASQTASDVASQTRSDLPSQSTSYLPSESIREVVSDATWEITDTDPMSDLASSSDSPSISVIHSEIICDVHHQPTEEFSRQATRAPLELPLQPLRASHLPSTSEVQQPSTNEVQQPSTSEINPDIICELQSQSSSNLYIQPKFDLRESIADIDEIYMGGTKHTYLTKLQVILQGSNRTALFIMFGLITAKHLSGNIIITQNLEMLFSKTTIDIKPNVATILVLAISFISGTLTILTVDRVGRRALLILSTLGSCFTLCSLATYLLVLQRKLDDSIDPTFPLINLIIYQAMFQIGLGTLPNVFLCDLFPTELRGCVGAIIVIFDNIITFTVSKLYQVIADNVTSYSIYYIFATSCSFAFMMVFIFIPETKRKTYHQIEALLVSNNWNYSNEEARIDRKDTHKL